MKELLEDIARWRATGKQVALARVVGTDGSGPRDPGAAMAVNEDSEVIGSVSGGCVEGAVLTEGLKVLERGIPKLVTYGNITTLTQAFLLGRRNDGGGKLKTKSRN